MHESRMRVVLAIVYRHWLVGHVISRQLIIAVENERTVRDDKTRWNVDLMLHTSIDSTDSRLIAQILSASQQRQIISGVIDLEI